MGNHETDSPETAIGEWNASRETISGTLRLIMGAWSEHPDDPLSVLCEMCYMVHCLRHASHGFVAYDGTGSVIGVCLIGAITNGHLHDDAAWAEREEHLASFLKSLTWWRREASETLADIEEEDGMARQAMSAGMGFDAEIMLLVVDGRYKGRGIGGRLVAEARRLAERRRWASLFLVTDTWCDWQVYERWGFTRILAIPSPSDLSCLRMAYAFTPTQMPCAQEGHA